MRLQVLIVEDNFLIAMALEDAIVKLGHDVVGIAAGRSQALDFADVAQIALIDINLLDGPTGVTIACELSRRGTTVIFLTADPGAVTGAVQGALGIVAKPVQGSDLKKILKFVASRRAGQSAACPNKLHLFEH